MTHDPVVRFGPYSARGRTEDGVAVFRGVPYAAGPVGRNRFGAPEPALWTGEFDAREPGPTAPQGGTARPGVPDLTPILGPGWVRGADYLNLDVWTPDPGAGGLPVMVFLHGGAFVGGAGSAPGYDGTRFAEDGIVLVTVNYRLGVPGFLSLPGAPDNRGLRDQIAALRWVQEHIAAFGGDPGNVTVFGESAGALSVGALLAAAPAGLFRRAISQSGGASHALTPAQAEVVTTAVARHLGVPATVDGFAGIADDRFVDVLGRLAAEPVDLSVAGQRDPLMGLSKLGPVLDGDLLAEQPVDAVRAGAADEIDLLVGSNSDEMNLYLVALPAPPVTGPALRAAVSALHPDPDGLIGAYRTARGLDDPGELYSAIGTDYLFAVPTARLADAHATHSAGTWRYEFTWRSPAFGGRLGACHGLELPFVFDLLGRVDFGVLGVSADEPTRELARKVHAAWVAFARDGDPGWPRYAPGAPVVQRIGPEWTDTTGADGPERELWRDVR
ncbi:carboxylesterase/lipase family protein [Amycolatopsis thermophila]|uniref:Carboxylic ester hydrolase n=1 Tax=Amycolatopsis thermophila TaxID=206084 RepID=A0ABU0F388_9PSEU|nr:carboxylesterase family protein [Amycolatopsis thermophila]MDQ0382017.1 para-nitrobenzyl esterase [Amycolatopsis thermophila]